MLHFKNEGVPKLQSLRPKRKAEVRLRKRGIQTKNWIYAKRIVLYTWLSELHINLDEKKPCEYSA